MLHIFRTVIPSLNFIISGTEGSYYFENAIEKFMSPTFQHPNFPTGHKIKQSHYDGIIHMLYNGYYDFSSLMIIKIFEFFHSTYF
jgi:hypothetical protein